MNILPHTIYLCNKNLLNDKHLNMYKLNFGQDGDKYCAFITSFTIDYEEKVADLLIKTVLTMSAVEYNRLNRVHSTIGDVEIEIAYFPKGIDQLGEFIKFYKLPDLSDYKRFEVDLFKELITK